MSVVYFSLVAINTLLFVALLFLSLRYWRREASERTRRLWLIVAIVTGALVFGSIQRLVLQAVILGWLPGRLTESVITEWQFVQSLIVGVLAVMAFGAVRSITTSLSSTERIAGSMLDRVSQVDVASLELSPREREVLVQIGSGFLTDAELSAALHISTSTVQTHVKRLLRKTGLSSRRDLIAVAHMIEVHE